MSKVHGPLHNLRRNPDMHRSGLEDHFASLAEALYTEIE